MRMSLRVALFCIFCVSCAISQQAPTIASISPASGVVGTQITIAGTGFGATAGTASVNWTNATVQSWSDTQVVVTVTPGTTTGPVLVVNGGVTSNGVTFTMPNPQITGISPTSGGVGTQITITGTGFGTTQGTASVNWTNATIQSWSDTEVVATVGGGTSSGGVRVFNGGVSSNAVTFTMPNPQIASISPTTGGVGTQITITGTGFGASTGTVCVNWTNATIQSWSDTQVVATVGGGTSSGGVRVVNAGVISNAVDFTMPNPQIASISPTSGGVGTQITITGTGFGTSTGTASVNWTNATIQSWSNTQVVATVGSGTSTGGVRVVNAGVSSNAVTFTMPNPQIASISPTSGGVGTQITITGTGFGASTGTASVNWTNATIQSWSDTQVVATVGAGTSSGGVRVFTGGVSSNAVTFSMPNPQITSISPTSGPVGTQITITGTGFGASTGTASVNWTNATIQSWSDTQVVATVGTGTSSGGVRVFTGGVSSNAVTFTTPNPQITSISPTSGPIGTAVTITGTGFGASTDTASVNWTTATIQSWSDTQVVATVAAGTTSGGVRVFTGGVSSNAVTFTIGAPAGFINAGNASTARLQHTATLLNNGQVLLVGGINNSRFSPLFTAELYNPASGAFTTTGNLNTGRYLHTSTLLNDGTVLIAGGEGDASSGRYLATAELYNPATGSFTPTNNMTTARLTHTATLLNNGNVLMAGGNGSGPTAEFYNPTTGTFVATGNMTTDRSYHTATSLNNGMVLIVGGYDSNGYSTATAELYNPATGTFAATGNLNNARNSHTATLLNGGTVLIAGGFDDAGNALTTAEIYDPSSGAFTVTGSPITARNAYAATLLNNGSVLFVEGYDNNYNDIASSELYDPTAGAFTLTANENIARDSHTATLLGNGAVLIAGGENASGYALTAGELYQPATLVPPSLVSVEMSPSSPTAAIALTQHFTAVGTFADGSTQTLASATWTSSDNSVATITNDTTNQGNGFPLSSGSVTLNACVGSICGSSSMMVNPSNLTSITITPSTQTILIGSTIQYRAIGTFADGGTEDLTGSVTWNSSSPAVATISSSGLANTFIKGTANITASFNGASGSTTLNVVLPLAEIEILPRNGFVAQGGTQQFTAIGTYTDGSTTDLTNTVSWSASPNTVAGINSTGLVTALTPGTATITASWGQISSSATFTVTAQMVSIAINPPNPSIPFGLSEPLTATGTFSDGSTQDVTGDVTWTSSSSAVATVTSAGLVTPVTQGTTTITAAYGAISVSAPLTVAAPALVTAVLNPQNPVFPAGVAQQFTATGTFSDGTTQDVTTLVTWGSGNSSIASVSASGLVTTGSSGTTAVFVALNGFTFSTNVTVSTAGPPSIVASVLPAPNDAGWNNSSVTVTFTCSPGSSAITTCPAPQVVSSEGTNQLVSGTVTDASGNTATTSVTVNIDETPPVLGVASPIDGETFSVPTISSTGTVTDSLSGIATLTCNGIPVSNSGGSFSCNIPINPGVNLVVVRALDIAGNVALTKMHVNDSLPLPSPNSLQITPAHVNLVVGDTHQFSVVDELGHPRTDAAWTVSDPAVATITSESKPVLTAITVGQLTLTATVQGASAQIQLTILNTVLAPGTANWNVPNVGGAASPLSVAVPAGDGNPGLYYSSGQPGGSGISLVNALTSDGQLLWQRPYPSATAPISFIPDAFGGAIAQTSSASSPTQGIVDLDGQTGSQVWQYSSLNGFSNFAVRPDGAVVALEAKSPTQLDSNPVEWDEWLNVFDGNTGQRIVHYRLPQSIYVKSVKNDLNCGVSVQASRNTQITAPLTTQITIDASGNAYLEFTSYNTVLTSSVTECNAPYYTIVDTQITNSTTSILTVSPTGSVSTQQLKSDTGTLIATALQFESQVASGTISSTCATSGSSNYATQAIPDGQGGVLALWTEDTGNGCLSNNPIPPTMVTHLSPQNPGTYSLPVAVSAPLTPVVLGENGVAYTMGAIAGQTTFPFASQVYSFDMNSGQGLWSYDVPAGASVNLVASTDDGGLLVAKSSTTNTDLIHIDSQGNPRTLASLPLLVAPPAFAWSGQWYASFVGGGEAAIDLPVGADSASVWATPAGDASHQNASAALCECLLQFSDTGQDSTSSTTPTISQAISHAELTPIANSSTPSSCDICTLPPPTQGTNQTPSCTTFAASGPTYLLLVGDPGNGIHNVRQSFNITAQTAANELQTQGNNVVACRVSSVQNVVTALTAKAGFIGGGVIYYGHSGPYTIQDLFTGEVLGRKSLLEPGEGKGADTNIDIDNVGNLAAVVTAYNGSQNILGPNASIVLKGCQAGVAVRNYGSRVTISIAQLISDMTQRAVYAYTVGTYFSLHDVSSATSSNWRGEPYPLPSSLPLYLVPEGPAGHKPALQPFKPE